MLPVPEASMPAVRDLLGEIGGRDDALGEADIVVRQEDHLSRAPTAVGVDDLVDVVDELDDQLGALIGRAPPCRRRS